MFLPCVETYCACEKYLREDFTHYLHLCANIDYKYIVFPLAQTIFKFHILFLGELVGTWVDADVLYILSKADTVQGKILR